VRKMCPMSFAGDDAKCIAGPMNAGHQRCFSRDIFEQSGSPQKNAAARYP